MTTQLTRAEIDERARRHYRQVYGVDPDLNTIQDHGSPVLRTHLEQEMSERMENCRREVQARHRRDQGIETKRKNQQEAHDQARAEAFEADLRDRFTRQFPGAPASDFAAARPALLAQVAEEGRAADEQALRRARAAIGL